jgi:hypothetical protein
MPEGSATVVMVLLVATRYCIAHLTSNGKGKQMDEFTGLNGSINIIMTELKDYTTAQKLSVLGEVKRRVSFGIPPKPKKAQQDFAQTA